MELLEKGHLPALSFHRTLSAWGYPVAVVNPLRARLFAQACGMPAKTDRLDARLLALMAEALKPAPAPPVPARLAELAELVQAARRRSPT